MPSDYSGIATALAGLLPSGVNVASSTNTTPIAVTTAAPHGAETGDTVMVHNHLVNTNANGARQIVKTSATSFLLVGSSGNGVGGATGRARSAAFGSRFNRPSGTDVPNAASVNVPIEALGDRSALLLYLLQYAQTVYGGGTTTYNDGAEALFKAGAGLAGEDGALILGKFQLASGALLELLASSEIMADASALIRLKNNSTTQFDAGAIFTVATLLDILSGGSVVVRAGGLIDVKGDGVTTGTGDMIVRGGAKLDIEANALLQVDALATVELKGTIDASGGGIIYDGATTVVGTKTDATVTTRTGKTIYSGDNAFVGGRPIEGAVDADHTFQPWKFEYLDWGSGGITDNRSWTFDAPPGGERIVFFVFGSQASLSSKQLSLRNPDGSLILATGGASPFVGGVTLRWNPATSKYRRVDPGT